MEIICTSLENWKLYVEIGDEHRLDDIDPASLPSGTEFVVAAEGWSRNVKTI